ncbi:MAG: molybdopterin-dependent oxidoreductase, partial [Pseudomonadota bacterium]
TRCVRFAHEVAGIDDIGLVNRGEGAEITTLGKAIGSELSGNVIDLCPVGALTSKPYAFTARPWELRKTETIDAMDAVGTNIRIDARGNEVLRIVPRLNEAVNEEWLADKGRFCVDALRVQRLDRPYVRDNNGTLRPASWQEALQVAAQKLQNTKPKSIAAIVGGLCDLESIYALQSIMRDLQVPNIDCREDGAKIDARARGNYLFNTTIAGIEQADALLLIGCNPRAEAPIINARIRKRWLQGGLSVAAIGTPMELTYDFQAFGSDITQLDKFLTGRHAFARSLRSAKNPMVILGAGALRGKGGEMILAATQALCKKFKTIRDDWNGFNLLHTQASRVGALDLGFLPAKGGMAAIDVPNGVTRKKIECVYLLGADEIEIPDGCFVIYQGHHGDRGAARADVILPGLAYTEKSGTYVNTEGRVQMGKKAVFGPGEAKEDWAILRALSGYLANILPFDDLGGLRKNMREEHPLLRELDHATAAEVSLLEYEPGGLPKGRFVPTIENYYMSDVISRHSQTMAECTRVFLMDDIKATGTDG